MRAQGRRQRCEDDYDVGGRRMDGRWRLEAGWRLEDEGCCEAGGRSSCSKMRRESDARHLGWVVVSLSVEHEELGVF